MVRRSTALLVTLSLALLQGCASMHFGPPMTQPYQVEKHDESESRSTAQLYEFPLEHIEWTDLEEFDEEAQYILLGTAGIATLVLIGVVIVDPGDD